MLIALLLQVADAELDRAVQRATQGGFWGVVLVARDGEVVFEKAYGFSDYAETPMTPDSRFEIASTSKMFTAAAILKLESQRKLRVEDPISKYVGDVPEDKSPITIHHLLSHTSGISGEVGLPYNASETADELVAHVMAAPLASDPGTKWEYCNVGYALLGVIIEKASGGTFEDYLRRELFEPAGMKHTGFIGDGGPATARLSGGRLDGTAVDWHWSWGYRGMGGIVTTARDLLAWHRAAVLDAAAFKKQTTPVLGGYGYGCLIDGDTMSHAGAVAGYRCQYARSASEVVIILSNEACNVYALQSALGPTVSLTASLDGRPLNEFGALLLESGARLERDGAALVVRDDAGEIARLTLPPDAAASAHERLRAVIDAKGEKAEGEPQIGVGVYTLGYGSRTLALDGLGITVMAEYRHSEGVDPRTTLVVTDPASGQWPLMVHMNAAAAEALAKSLDPSARDR